MSDNQNKQRSQSDAELEREIRQERKYLFCASSSS
jgi:hypothetical protein